MKYTITHGFFDEWHEISELDDTFRLMLNLSDELNQYTLVERRDRNLNCKLYNDGQRPNVEWYKVKRLSVNAKLNVANVTRYCAYKHMFQNYTKDSQDQSEKINAQCGQFVVQTLYSKNRFEEVYQRISDRYVNTNAYQSELALNENISTGLYVCAQYSINLLRFTKLCFFFITDQKLDTQTTNSQTNPLILTIDITSQSSATTSYTLYATSVNINNSSDSPHILDSDGTSAHYESTYPSASEQLIRTTFMVDNPSTVKSTLHGTNGTTEKSMQITKPLNLPSFSTGGTTGFYNLTTSVQSDPSTIRTASYTDYNSSDIKSSLSSTHVTTSELQSISILHSSDSLLLNSDGTSAHYESTNQSSSEQLIRTTFMVDNPSTVKSTLHGTNSTTEESMQITNPLNLPSFSTGGTTGFYNLTTSVQSDPSTIRTASYTDYNSSDIKPSLSSTHVTLNKSLNSDGTSAHYELTNQSSSEQLIRTTFMVDNPSTVKSTLHGTNSTTEESMQITNPLNLPSFSTGGTTGFYNLTTSVQSDPSTIRTASYTDYNSSDIKPNLSSTHVTLNKSLNSDGTSAYYKSTNQSSSEQLIRTTFMVDNTSTVESTLHGTNSTTEESMQITNPLNLPSFSTGGTTWFYNLTTSVQSDPSTIRTANYTFINSSDIEPNLSSTHVTTSELQSISIRHSSDPHQSDNTNTTELLNSTYLANSTETLLLSLNDLGTSQSSYLYPRTTLQKINISGPLIQLTLFSKSSIQISNLTTQSQSAPLSETTPYYSNLSLSTVSTKFSNYNRTDYSDTEIRFNSAIVLFPHDTSVVVNSSAKETSESLLKQNQGNVTHISSTDQQFTSSSKQPVGFSATSSGMTISSSFIKQNPKSTYINNLTQSTIISTGTYPLNSSTSLMVDSNTSYISNSTGQLNISAGLSTSQSITTTGSDSLTQDSYSSVKNISSTEDIVLVLTGSSFNKFATLIYCILFSFAILITLCMATAFNLHRIQQDLQPNLTLFVDNPSEIYRSNIGRRFAYIV
ncbi:hypothetical protein GJ496_009080 [Pomphorhynchus laevis]|nr:hypothetical protein GJ496_009080 [Pomphorhynchus laevis]